MERNFLRLDPSYGGKGLTSGGAEEESVWRDFADERSRLAAAAAAIRARAARQATPEETTADAADGEEEFPEGTVLFRAHRSRERNAAPRGQGQAAPACDTRSSGVRDQLRGCHHIVVYLSGEDRVEPSLLGLARDGQDLPSTPTDPGMIASPSRSAMGSLLSLPAM
jgi:hypothetical protein